MKFLTPFVPYIIGGVVLLFGGFYLYNYLQTNFGAGTPDPGGGAPSTGIVSGLLNSTAELGKSSLSYSDALAQAGGNTTTTIDTILGGSQGPTAVIPAGSNNPNDPAPSFWSSIGL